MSLVSALPWRGIQASVFACVWTQLPDSCFGERHVDAVSRFKAPILDVALVLKEF
jgi:hypothetical protein